MMKIVELEKYCALSRARQESLCKDLARSLPRRFQFDGLGDGDEILPSFLQQSSGVRFKLVFGGTFDMGCGASEERAARRIQDPPPISFEELRPVHPELVSPFLMSITPVLRGEADSLSKGKVSASGLPGRPAFVPYEKAVALANSLECRLPREAEWEYACRGRTVSLFPWGDQLLPPSELAPWMDNNFSGNPARSGNRFGLKGLMTGEWCLDEYRSNYSPSAKVQQGVHVVRGGGSLFWPWQNSGEWVWCMPSMRMPSTSLPPEGTCGFRLVYPLE